MLPDFRTFRLSDFPSRTVKCFRTFRLPDLSTISTMKIISGGQTGVDRAALDVALELNLECGGFCPKGRRSEDGVIPEKYPLTETATAEYSERTELNVKTSDGTLILIDKHADKGTELTNDLCKVYRKPYVIVDVSANFRHENILQWITKNNIYVLNIAGSRESSSPGIYQKANAFLRALLQKKIE